MVAVLFPSPTCSSNDGYADPSKAQYHIQTDEGPERYFRYQTLSGQYRKEKRLEDGTVIGTYAWVDDDGILRQRDYIADSGGYRILKSKNVFVGRSSPIGQAIKYAKNAPANAGTLVKPNPSPSSKVTPNTYGYSSQPKTFSYSTPNLFGYRTPTEGQYFQPAYSSLPQEPTSSFGYGPTVTPTPFEYSSQTPYVEISSNSFPSTTPSTIETYIPSSTILPPIDDTTGLPCAHCRIPGSSPATVYIPSTTPAPTTAYPSTHVSSTPESLYVAQPPSSTVAPPIASNSLDSFYSGDPQYEHYPENEKFVNPYIFQNGPTYPIDQNGHTYTGFSNNLGNGDDGRYQKYDGVSVTNDGFRYFLPKQYHEEQRLSGDRTSGSFGYVDPFGIRRVVYYNAGPGTGFQHRKNNRYVGLDAAPYDARPY